MGQQSQIASGLTRSLQSDDEVCLLAASTPSIQYIVLFIIEIVKRREESDTRRWELVKLKQRPSHPE